LRNTRARVDPAATARHGPVRNKEESLNANLSAAPVVAAGSVKFGNDLPISIIAGPCQLESRSHALEVAGALKEIGRASCRERVSYHV
jgi:3-deoxy-D-arabino-heptulosonate 7-phosphate (DAHP) synthase